MSIRGCVLTLSVFVMAVSATDARADECPVRVLSLNFEGKGTSNHVYRYRVVLEATSRTAPRDVDVEIETGEGRSPIIARAARLQFYADEDAYDDVMVFDRPSQDVSGIAVVDTVSGDVTNPCTSPTVQAGDQVVGLTGWNIPTVIATFDDSDRHSLDVSHIDLLTAKSADARFKTKGEVNYSQIAQNMGVTGEVIVRVTVGPAGQLEAAKVDTSSGSVVLDAAAIDAAERTTFSASMMDGIPIVAEYKIVYEFRLDGVPWSGPPDMSDLLRYYCPTILGGVQLATGLNAGQAFWYDLNLSTFQSRFDSVVIKGIDVPSDAEQLVWDTILRGYGDTMGASRDSSIDYSSMQGALFWPGSPLTFGAVQEVTEHAKKSATCKPYPAKITNTVDSDSIVAVAQTDRPWLTSPVVETVLPAQFATVSWPTYVNNANAPQQPISINVNVHVTQSGEPLVAVVHDASVAPAFASAALAAAMASTYVVPRTADGSVITQTFDVYYLYVPATAAAGKPVGAVSVDRSDGNRRHPPHH